MKLITRNYILVFLLFISSIPAYSQISGSSQVCASRTSSYSSQSSGSSYYWSVSGGMISGSRTNSSVSVVWGSGTNGNIYLTVGSSGGGGPAGQLRQQEKIGATEQKSSLSKSKTLLKTGNVQQLRAPIIGGGGGTYFKSVSISNLTAGSITGAKTICYNASAGTLSNTSSGSGSGSFQWQVSSNNSSWSNVSGATSSSYSPGNLTSSRYYRRRKFSIACGYKYTSSRKITVRTNLSAGSIGNAQALCYNGNPNTLTNTASALGGVSRVYQWQKSTSSSTGGFSNISGATASTYNPPALTRNTWYKRRVISGSGCGTKYTNVIKVTIYGNLSAGSIGNAQTLCYNGNPSTLTNTASVSGGISRVYQWQKSTSSSTSGFSNISGATASTYNPPALTRNTWYKRRVISGSGCGTKYTNVIKVTIYGNLSAGSIGNAQTLCYNGNPSTLTSTASALGGVSRVYQWQKSTSSSTGGFSNISGATASTYNPAALTQNTWYKRRVISGSGCGTKYTNVIKVTIYGNLSAGSIGNAQTLCYNGNPSTLTSTASASGGVSRVYQWQKSTSSSTSGFSNISGATASTYNPAALTQNTWYKRRVISGSGCGTKYTNVIKVTIYGNLSAGSINGAKTICYNTSAGTLSDSSSASGGTGSHSYQWQVSTDNSSWSNVSGATGTSYSPGNLTSTRYYRRGVTSGSCGTLYSSSQMITVYSNLSAGSISGASAICNNTSAGTLSNSSSASGGTGSYSYQWQVSTDNSSWSDVSGATGTSYSPGNLTSTRYYRRGVTSGSCGTLYSSSQMITVYGNLSAGNISGANTICHNTSAGTLSNSSSASGGTGSYSYQWQVSMNNSSWSDVSGASGTSYSPGNLDSTKYFRRGVTSGSCSTLHSNSVLISVDLVVADAGLDFVLEQDDSSVYLSGLPSGGTWSGTGVTGDVFDPSITGLGEYLLSYTFTDSIGCTGLDTLMVTVVPDQGQVVDSMEITALKDLYESTGGAGWADNTGWPVDEAAWSAINYVDQIIGWKGITLIEGDIKKVVLNSNNLNGAIPTSIGNLSSLTVLNLQYNFNIIGQIPNEIEGLTNLSELWLSHNQLTGEIPLGLYKLTNLSKLMMTHNQLSGTLSDQIGALKKLVYLYLSNNQLTGDLPPEMGQMTKLKYPKIGNNQFIGSIPLELSQCMELTQVNLNDNNFSGSFPAWLIEMPLVTVIDLASNQFIGEVPISVSNKDNLIHFIVDNNNLSGDFPDLSMNIDLVKLSINDNNFTSFPKLSNHSNFTNLNVTIENNRIPFADIEANLNVDGSHTFTSFTYSNQSPILANITASAVTEGDQFVIDTYDVSLNNSYTWEKEVSGVWSDVSSENEHASSDRFVISNITPDDVGVYRYSITNSISGLSKTSEKMHLRTISDDIFNGLMFQYKYDHRQRMIEKQVPGAGAVYMVYDNRDRLVLTQDANQRDPSTSSGREWIFTKYDVLNRPVMTGIYTHDAEVDQHEMSALISTADFTETYNGAADNGYTTDVFPTINLDYLTVTYYDNHNFRDDLSEFTTEYNFDELQLGCKETNDNYCFPTKAVIDLVGVKGQVTGSKVKNLDDNTWLKSVSYYDDRYRVIQTITENQKGGADRSSNLYDFVGKVLETKTSHDDGSSTNYIKRNFDYDHAGRLIDTRHKMETDVDWQGLIGLTQNDNNDLVHTGSSGYDNSGAYGSQMISQESNGYFEVEVQQLDRVLIGLNDHPENAGRLDMEYAIYLRNNRYVYIYENGVKIPEATNLVIQNIGDKFSIAKIGDNIEYRKNGQTFFYSPQTVSSDLYPDITTYYAGDKITRAIISTSGKVLLSHNAYNELGELIDKQLHSTDDGASFEQSVDYRYNIRGWLTSINDASLEDTIEGSNPDTGTEDYFGMNLAYNTGLDGLNTGALAYNGNISAMKWSGDAVGEELGYGYNYDPMNRLHKANYQLIGGGASDAFDVVIGTDVASGYDLNGNIQALTRNTTGGAEMDNLGYTYSGNQLLSVTDTGDITAGFKDGNLDNVISNLGDNISNASTFYTTLSIVEHGGDSYIKVESDWDRSTPSVTLESISVTAGAQYEFRLKGYHDGINKPYLRVATNLGHVIYPAPELEKGIENEIQRKVVFSIPEGATTLSIGAGWFNQLDGADYDDVCYISEYELILLDASDYNYDANGNMTVDKNKGITSIEYNHLNLPSKVIKDDDQYIKYIYDAAGIKLAQEVYDHNDVLHKRTDYIGEFIYENENKVVHSSDFSSDVGGYTNTQATVLANVDNIDGFDDSMEIISTSTLSPRILRNLDTDETGRTFQVALKIFADSNFGNIEGLQMRNPAGTQMFQSFIPDQWNTLVFDYREVIADAPWQLWFRNSTNGVPTVGSKAYVRDITIREVFDSELAIIQHEEGRIIPVIASGSAAISSYDYQYHLKDHLGNTRVTFTTEPKTHEFELNYENNATDADDILMFEKTDNLIDADIHDYVHPDETVSHTYSQKLTGADNSIIGSVLTIPVGKGDQVNAEVYAKYLAATTTTNPVSSIAGAVIGAITGNTGTTNYEGAINGTVAADGSLVNALGNGVSSTEPMAFINLMFLADDATDITSDQFSYGQVSPASNNAHAILSLPEAFKAPSSGFVVVYLSNESNFLTEVYFDDLKVTVNESKIIQTDDYYPFGLQMAGGFQRSTGKENKYLYNGKEKQEDLDLGWLDYGARMYQPEIGRWGVIDPAADVLEMSTPYAYSLNNPINFIDPDGELPIYINGRVGPDSERGDASYWSAELLNTISGSGIANPGGERHFVDGDRYLGKCMGCPSSSLRNGSNLNGVNDSGARKAGGSRAAKADFKTILSKLERDPDSNKIIEKIQIYTHSRGAAFGEGYTATLLKLISDNADEFQDANNVVEFSLNLAPHQSGQVSAVDGVPTSSMTHKGDILSDDDMKGSVNFTSGVGNLETAHKNGSFASEVGAFLSAFLSSDKDNKKAMNQFIRTMEKAGIEVTVKQ